MHTIPELQAEINDYLAGALAADVDQETLREAMNYSLLAGGKRLRPALTLAVAERLGQSIGQAELKAATAVELLHTYSLIHDDLPAMDDDDLRRGKPTNHKKFGAGMATLAGDGLLTLTFNWLVANDLPAEVRLRLTQLLSQAAGPAGMVAGQARDIEGTGQTLTLDQLKRVHAQKTGALITYAVEAGGVLAQADEGVMASLRQFGHHYGLAFQIQDDLLDVLGTEAEAGKEVHRDAAAHKNTYPALLGVAGAKQALTDALVGAKQAESDLLAAGMAAGGLQDFLAYFED